MKTTTHIGEVKNALLAARQANAIGCPRLAKLLVKGYSLSVLLVASTLLRAEAV